jgi:hypothetical protein
VPLRPALDGPNNKREAKIAAMREAMPGVQALSDEQRFHCWAYSDSPADIPLLEFAGNRVLVHPGAAAPAFPAARCDRPDPAPSLLGQARRPAAPPCAKSSACTANAAAADIRLPPADSRR